MQAPFHGPLLWALSTVAAASAVLSACAAEQRLEVPGTAAETVHYANALWFDGAAFAARDGYVRDGVFVEAPAGEPGETIDLEGGYVVPAFAEAHHHMVLCNPEWIPQFLDAGITYAGIMNARVSSRACQAESHGPDGLEISSALAGVTARQAHPFQIGLYFLEAEEVEGEWVHYVDSAAELETAWPRIASTAPDFLKIFVSYSEDYETLRADPELASWYRGLDPALVAPIVALAHEAQIRVAAHVMSASDFQVAVTGGVDIIAHMPGFAPGAAFTDDDPHPYLAMLTEHPERYVISEAAAQEAAAGGVAVITTVSKGEEPRPAPTPAPTPEVVRNFATLRTAGVPLLIGSDRGEFNSVDEAQYLVEHDLMPADEVLRSLAVTTPQTLFPNRHIGELAPGGEATFVVLGADPLADFGAIRDVRRVVKRGHQLRPAATADATSE